MNFAAIMRAYYTETLPDVIRIMGGTKFTIGSGHVVHVTHVNHPLSFYVRLATLRKVVQLLQKPRARVNIDTLAFGKLVVYKSMILKSYVRGSIQGIRVCRDGLGFVCDILAIDYGVMDVHIQVKHIYEPDQKTMNCAPLALHCQLTNCEPIHADFDNKAVHALNFYVGRYMAKIFIRSITSDTMEVELRTIEYREDISTLMSGYQYTCEGSSLYGSQGAYFLDAETKRPKPKEKPKPKYAYHHQTLQVGDKLHVRALSGYSIYECYFAEVEAFKKYNNAKKFRKFTKYCKKQPQLDVVEAMTDGRACAVKVSNPDRYERAIVLRITIPHKMAMVMLVDWGKEMEVSFEDLKHISGTSRVQDNLKRPILALSCKADRKQSGKYGLRQELIYPTQEFILEVTTPGFGFYVPHRVLLKPVYPPSTLAYLAPEMK